MKDHSAETIRNIAFIGHGGSGKTSFSEVLLHTAGEINRIGSISEGNTTSDYSPNEIEKQISITLTAMHLEWNGIKINMIDTPGFSDFIGEVKSAIKVVDTAVLMVKAVEGVEVGAEITYGLAEEENLPSAIIINKIDSEYSKFQEIYESVKEKITPNAVVVTFPAKEGLSFDTVVDVVKMKAYQYGPAASKKVTEIDIPADVADQAEEYRTQLTEKVAELSEDLMNKYFEEGALSEEELKEGLKASILARNAIPVFAVSSTKGVGMNNFLDFAVNFLPSPKERGAVEVDYKDKEAKLGILPDPKGEPVLFAFKTISEQHVGELSLFKVYSGTVNAGMDLINQNNSKTERLGQLSILVGRNRKDIQKLSAGDIGAVVKLKDTHTNNTLSSKNLAVIVPKISYPGPIINGAIIPKAKGDEDKIATGLHTLHEEDPTFSIKFDPEISQTIISGQGELQLNLAIKRLKDRYGVEVDLVEPKIPMREAIKGTCENSEYKHKKQSGGRGQFGHVVFKVEPMPRGAGFEFVDAIVGGVVPGRFIPATEKGVIETMAKGVLAGYPVVDVKVTLFFGSYHSVDSDDMSFKIAASQCFRKGFLEAKPMLLEPIYEVVITVPEENMGDVMGDVSSRRGKILGMDAKGKYQIIKANIPLAELYKYSSTLRSLTQGRGNHAKKFAFYDEVPKEVENKIVDEYKKMKEEGL